MRIDQILTGVPTPPRAAATAQGWLVGQLLTIGVIGRIDENSIRLSVDGREMTARTTLELQPGTRYAARVTATGAQAQLSIVDTRAAPPGMAPGAQATPLSQAVTIRAAMATTLPTQEPLDAVLTLLDERATGAARSAGTSAPAMTPGAAAVQARLVTLTAQLPPLPALAQAAQLQRAVETSGPLLEASLGAQSTQQTPQLPTQDIKFQLLNLRQAIDEQLLASMPGTSSSAPARAAQSAPPDAATALAQSQLRSLAAEVDAGVARITHHQLQHLAAAEHGSFYAFAELPFRTDAGIDSVRLEIESDDEAADRDPGAAGDGTGLAVSLAVPLEDLGELRARIGLAGDRLAITLWSEQSDLRELIADDVGALETRLREIGFELTPIALREVASPDPFRRRPTHLVDTSA